MIELIHPHGLNICPDVWAACDSVRLHHFYNLKEYCVPIILDVVEI